MSKPKVRMLTGIQTISFEVWQTFRGVGEDLQDRKSVSGLI